MKKNRAGILGTDVRPLPVRRGRIVARPENLQQIFVANFLRIEFDFNRFRVSRAAGANVFIAWVFSFSARVAGNSRGHSRRVLELASTPQKHSSANVAFAMALFYSG